MRQGRVRSVGQGARLASPADRALSSGAAVAILLAGAAVALGWWGKHRPAEITSSMGTQYVLIRDMGWADRSGLIRVVGKASPLLQGTRIRLAARAAGGDEYYISEGSHTVCNRDPDPWELDVAVPLGSGLSVYQQYRVLAFASDEPEWPQCLSAQQFGRWRFPAVSRVHSLRLVPPAPERPASARIAIVALIVALMLQVARRVESPGVTWVALVLALVADYLPLSPHEQVPAAIIILAAANIAAALLLAVEARRKGKGK